MKINSRIATTKTNNVIMRGMVTTSTGISFALIIGASSVKKNYHEQQGETYLRNCLCNCM